MTNLARINRMPTPWVGFDPRPVLVTTLPPVTQIQSGSHLLLRLFQKDASCLGTVLLNTCESSSTYAKVYPRSKMGRPVVMKKTLGNMQNLHVGTLWSKIQGLRVSNETHRSLRGVGRQGDLVPVTGSVTPGKFSINSPSLCSNMGETPAFLKGLVGR